MNINERAGKALAGRWRAGMLDAGGRRVLSVADGTPDAWIESCGGVSRGPSHYGVYHSEWGVALPDMADPATVGAILDVVREAWETGRDERWMSVESGSGWCGIAIIDGPNGDSTGSRVTARSPKPKPSSPPSNPRRG